MMNNKIFSLSFLFLVSIIAATCKKQNTLEMELAKLPPATQTGQNTFGCLVNGKAWVAQNKDCFPYCDPSFKLFYDSEFNGNIRIQAIFKDSKKNIDQYFGLGVDSTNVKKFFIYSQYQRHMGFTYEDTNMENNCNIFKTLDSSITADGTLFITRYDLQSGIISGTFEFTLAKPGCDSIKITHGRFDKKL